MSRQRVLARAMWFVLTICLSVASGCGSSQVRDPSHARKESFDQGDIVFAAVIINGTAFAQLDIHTINTNFTARWDRSANGHQTIITQDNGVVEVIFRSGEVLHIDPSGKRQSHPSKPFIFP